MNYFIDTEQDRALDWLHPSQNIDFTATILCATNESVDMWNSVVQNMNSCVPKIILSKDTFSEVDDPHGHIQRMLSTSVLKRVFQIMSLF